MPEIRPARTDDIPAITAIYAHHVRFGTASFEEIPPDEAEMRRRYDALAGKGFPYLALEAEGEVLGYGYAGPYRPRSAYRFTLEDSIYLAESARGMGLGRILLSALIQKAEEGPFRQMVAVIGDSANKASIRLHETLGFRLVGVFRDVGLKHGQWRDTVLMQRALGPGASILPDGMNSGA